MNRLFIPAWPFSSLEKIENLFYDLQTTDPTLSSGFPKWDQKIHTDDKGKKTLIINFMLAGYPKENLSVRGFQDKIIISAKKVSDRDYNTFARRAFSKEFHDVAGNWDFEKSVNKYKDGILTISIPQRKEAEGKLLKIQ